MKISNKGSIKYQSYPKSRKIDAFKQKLYTCVTAQVINLCSFVISLNKTGRKKFAYDGKIQAKKYVRDFHREVNHAFTSRSKVTLIF